MTDDQKEVIAKIDKAIKIAGTWYDVPYTRLAAHLWAESTWAEEGTKPKLKGYDGHGTGVAQIDDRFHQFAMDPLDTDILLQICYEALLLKCLYKQANSNWDVASMLYNGDPQSPVVKGYGEKIKMFMDTKPWNKLLGEIKPIQ